MYQELTTNILVKRFINFSPAGDQLQALKLLLENAVVALIVDEEKPAAAAAAQTLYVEYLLHIEDRDYPLTKNSKYC